MEISNGASFNNGNMQLLQDLMFERAAKDKNGSFSKDELQDFLKYLNKPFDQVQLDQLFKMLDEDGDGNLARDTCSVLLKKLLLPDNQQEAQQP